MTSSHTRTSRILMLSLIGCCLITLVVGLIQGFNSAISGNQSRHIGSNKPNSFLSDDRLALIRLDGMIVESDDGDGLFRKESSALKTRRLLYEAAEDNTVKGVLLRINSPGGTVGMSQELYHAVQAVQRKKPIVASMGDVAASGGYYTASATDRIVANPGTLTASIGVILQSVNLQDLLTKKLGVKAVTIKSGKFKDLLSPYRAATTDEVNLLQHIINTSYHQFLRDVLAGRTHTLQDAQLIAQRKASIAAVADGRVVIGEEALSVGLVDKLGGQEEAKALLKKLVAERFEMKSADSLSLDEYESRSSVWQALGVTESHFPLSLFHTTTTLPISASPILPSAEALGYWVSRHTNQPLWIMSGF